MLISVLMSTYNETTNDIDKAINSILNQTISDLELIIVVDNPNNKNLICYLKNKQKIDPRITLLINKRNIGLAESLNKALLISKGKYIARMDADDISLPTRFQKQIDYFNNHPEFGIISTNVVNIDEDDNEISINDFIINDSCFFRKIMRYANVIVHPTVMMRKDILIDLGGYNNFKAAQDYDLWLRALEKGVIFYTIPEVLLKYRIRKSSISNSNFARQHGSMLYAKFLSQHRNLNFSEDGYEKYLKKIKMYYKKDIELYNRAYEMIFIYNKKNLVEKIFINLKAIFTHKKVFTYYFSSLKKDLIKSIYQKYTYLKRL